MVLQLVEAADRWVFCSKTAEQRGTLWDEHPIDIGLSQGRVASATTMSSMLCENLVKSSVSWSLQHLEGIEYWERPNENLVSEWSLPRLDAAQKQPMSMWYTPMMYRLLGVKKFSRWSCVKPSLLCLFVGRNGCSIKEAAGWPSFSWAEGSQLQLGTAAKRGLAPAPECLGTVTPSGLSNTIWASALQENCWRKGSSYNQIIWFSGFGFFCTVLAWYALGPGLSLLLLFVACFGLSTEKQCFLE